MPRGTQLVKGRLRFEQPPCHLHPSLGIQCISGTQQAPGPWGRSQGGLATGWVTRCAFPLPRGCRAEAVQGQAG